MTIQEAYNKGLSDAENRVIEVITSMVGDGIELMFDNPDLEKLKEYIRAKPVETVVIEEAEVEEPQTEAQEKHDPDVIDHMVAQFGSLVRNDVENQEELSDPRMEVIRKVLNIQLTWLHELSKRRNYNVGKSAKKAIHDSLSLLTTTEGVVI